MTRAVTIALPAELAERTDQFIAETGKDREQVVLAMLEWALFWTHTPSGRAAIDSEFAHMATDGDYQETIRQLKSEGWV